MTLLEDLKSQVAQADMLPGKTLLAIDSTDLSRFIQAYEVLRDAVKDEYLIASTVSDGMTPEIRKFGNALAHAQAILEGKP